MNDMAGSTLSELVDDLRRELAFANEELERSRDAHRRVESLLLAVLEHVPVAVVVVDDDQRVRAVSTEAERQWDARLDAPASSVDALHAAGLAELCRNAVETGAFEYARVPRGFGAAMTDEPGTDRRYIVVWSSSGGSATG